MKFTLAALYPILLVLTANHANAEESCTRGRLFISEADSSTVHVFELDDLSSLSTPFHSFAAPGGMEINLQSSSSETHVATIFRGTETDGYVDGVVSFHNAGISAEDHMDHFDIIKVDPSSISNAELNCARPVHYVTHDEKIAIFCDGSFDETQVNSSVWVVDETQFGMSTSAIVFNTTLQGSHHGVAVPVDDNHVLYSLAMPDRVNREPEASSLPATFRVVDYEGIELHAIADESSPNTSCMGFHGSAAISNRFALACDENHGGILLVDYEESSGSYTSRALMYPDEFPEHRTGGFADHPTAEYIIGNFNGPDEKTNLMAFRHSDTDMNPEQILILPDIACAYSVEKSEGEVVVVLLQSGMLHAFTFHDGAWEELASQQTVPNMSNCTGALLRTGPASAFVMYQPTNELYAIDLTHVEGGEIEVMASTLPFTPFDGVVTGFPAEVACAIHSHGDDHSKAMRVPLFVSSMVGILCAMFTGFTMT